MAVGYGVPRRENPTIVGPLSGFFGAVGIVTTTDGQTGTASWTEDDDTSSISATRGHTGTSAWTEADDTSSISATRGHVGTSSWTEVDDTFLAYTVQADVWIEVSPVGGLDPDDPTPGSNFGYQAVALASDGTVFCHLDATGLYRSTDHGETWTKWNTDGELDVGSAWTLQIDPFDDDIMWATSGYGSGGPLKSTDGGQTWTLISVGGPTQFNDVYSIALDPYLADHVLIGWHSLWSGSVASGISESFNGGTSWTHHSAAESGWDTGHAVFFLSDSDTWLVGTQTDGFWRTTNSGTSWTQVISENMAHGATDCLTKVDSTLFLACDHHIRTSTDDGENWTDITGTLSTGIFYSAVATDDVNLFTAGSYPITPDYSAAADSWYTRPVAGGSWTAMTGSPDTTFEGNSNGPRYAVNGDGYVFTANYMAGVWRFISTAQNAVDGTASWSEADDTLAGSGSSTHVGTIAVTDAADTMSASGSSTHVGTIAVTDDADTFAASGASTHIGTSAWTEADDTFAAAGSSTHAGTASWTETDDTLSAAGYLPNDGPAAWTEADDTLTSSGLITRVGTASWTEDADTFTAIGGGAEIAGPASWTEADDTMAAVGRITRNGTVAWTEADDTFAAVGTSVHVGTAAWTEADDAFLASANITRIGTVTWTESDTFAASGFSTHTGTAAWTEESDVFVFIVGIISPIITGLRTTGTADRNRTTSTRDGERTTS